MIIVIFIIWQPAASSHFCRYLNLDVKLDFHFPSYNLPKCKREIRNFALDKICLYVFIYITLGYS